MRFEYDPKTSKRLGQAEPILTLPGYGYNQHWTRSLAFSSDGNTLFVAVGSKTKVSVESGPRRAAILAMTPDGPKSRVYASGLRNAVGLAINPSDGRLWATVNERDDIGDELPSDYFTRVSEAVFYGWPYSYLERSARRQSSCGETGSGEKSACAGPPAGSARSPASVCLLRATTISACLPARRAYCRAMAPGTGESEAATKSSLSHSALVSLLAGRSRS